MKRYMWLPLFLVVLVGVGCNADAAPPLVDGVTGAGDPATSQTCPVTGPPSPPLEPPGEFIEFIIRGASPPTAREQVRPLAAGYFWYGNEAVWLSLPEDGVLRYAKQGWWRSKSGKLEAVGRRHGATPSESFVPVLHAPDGYGERGFQASGWDFPSQGCWDVVVRVGSGDLRFTVLVAIPDEQR